MVQFDDGRVQLIPFTWDSRAKESGGQRCTTSILIRRQTMSFIGPTLVKIGTSCVQIATLQIYSKGYDKATNQYETTWSEINVGCEACHGPASVHIELQSEAARGALRLLTTTVSIVIYLKR